MVPDGCLYYSHITRKTTTDIDLRKDRNLSAVTVWMDDRESESTDVDLEGWLRKVKAKPKKSSGWGSGKAKREEKPASQSKAKTGLAEKDDNNHQLAYA